VCGDGERVEGCEECDDGNLIDGDGCDSNCTLTACGNGVLTVGEECEDGNSNEHDECKNDCRANVCGDAVIHIGVERCDDGNLVPGDGCEPNCELPPELASASVVAGGTLTTDVEADGATATDPVETWVTSPNAGLVSIEEGALAAGEPDGFSFLGQAVHITMPAATVEDPAVVVLRVDATLLPTGSDENAVEFSKDGALIAGCEAGLGVAAPDPCIRVRSLLGDGDVEVTILTSTASEWGTVTPVHDAWVSVPGPVSLKIKSAADTVRKKVKVRVASGDSGRATSQRVRLSAHTESGCVPIIEQLPDLDRKVPFVQDAAVVRSGKSLSGRMVVSSGTGSRRCRVVLSADTLVANNVDPTPENNIATFEVDVVDEDAEDRTAEDIALSSMRPVRLTIEAGEISAGESLAVSVSNRKLDGAARVITVEGADGDCPVGTVGMVDFDSET
jgi:cysteine-rich repeat protein